MTGEYWILLQSLSLSTCKRPYIVTKGFCKINLKQTNDLYLLALNFLTDTQRAFFENLKLLTLGRQIRPKILGAFGVFSAYLLAPTV